MDPAIIIALATLVFGPTGAIIFALRFNREDAKAAVGTMRDVAAELRLELERTIAENKELRAEVVALRTECGHLRIEVTKLRESNEAHGY